MNRFDRLFAPATQRAFIPFFTLGDPDRERSLEVIRTAVDAGADGIELGFPFSDPITDGPTNQRSMQRSLKSGVTYDICIDMLRQIRAHYPALPIGLLLYYNLIYMRGFRGYQELADIGVDAVVCSDLPLEESAEHQKQLALHDIGCIQMVAPNTPAARAARLIHTSTAFTYVISRFGTTGASETFGSDALNRVSALKGLSDKPAVVGFGISKPEQVRAFWAAGADGVIVGSHFSALIERHLDDPGAAKTAIAGFIHALDRRPSDTA